MHKASWVYEMAPSATPEGREDRRPSITRREPAAAAEDRNRQPEGQRDSDHPQNRAGRRRGASNEGVTSSGRKKTTQEPPRTSRGRTRGIQSPESQKNRGPIEDPKTSPLEPWHHKRTSNERRDRAAGTPHRDRRRVNRARKRQGGADARLSLRSSTKVADSPSKAEGHSRTTAPDAEATAATLSMTAPSNYRQK